MATFVVTGTGRCGTAHCWRVLQQLGVPASHETFFEAGRRTFDDRDRDAYRAAPANDVALFAAPFLGDIGVPSLHLVRDPIDTVNSFLHLRLPLSAAHPLCEFINHWVTPDGESDEERWVDFWEKWNHMCAARATVTVRVEALTSGDVDHEAIAAVVGTTGFVERWQTLGVTPNRVHAVDSVRVPEYLQHRLRRAGAVYGYAE